MATDWVGDHVLCGRIDAAARAHPPGSASKRRRSRALHAAARVHHDRIGELYVWGFVSGFGPAEGRARVVGRHKLGAAPVTGRVAVAARPVMHAAACVRRCAAGEGVTGIHAHSWRFTRGGAAPAVGTSGTGFCLCPGRGGVLRALLLACTHARTRAPPPAAAAAAAASLQERKIIARRRTGFPCPGPGLTACSSCPTNHIGPVPILACVVYPQLRT